VPFPFSLTRPAAIKPQALVREQNPIFESARASPTRAPPLQPLPPT